MTRIRVDLNKERENMFNFIGAFIFDNEKKMLSNTQILDELIQYYLKGNDLKLAISKETLIRFRERRDKRIAQTIKEAN